MTDNINHPVHYGGDDNPYEAIKVIEALGLGYGFCVGNALKYLIRADKKNDLVEDLRKAAWYCNRAADSAYTKNLLDSVLETEEILSDPRTLEAVIEGLENLEDLIARPTNEHHDSEYVWPVGSAINVVYMPDEDEPQYRNQVTEYRTGREQVADVAHEAALYFGLTELESWGYVLKEMRTDEHCLDAGAELREVVEPNAVLYLVRYC